MWPIQINKLTELENWRLDTVASCNNTIQILCSIKGIKGIMWRVEILLASHNGICFMPSIIVLGYKS